MYSLKKALTKDDTRKYNKSKIEISSFKQPTLHKNIEEMLLKVNHTLLRIKIKLNRVKVFMTNSKKALKIIFIMEK